MQTQLDLFGKAFTGGPQGHLFVPIKPVNPPVADQGVDKSSSCCTAQEENE